MATDRDFELLVRRWLRGDADGSADRVVDEALALVELAPQRRPVATLASRSMDRAALAGIAAAAVVVVALVATALGQRPGVTGAGETPSRSPRFTPRPTLIVPIGSGGHETPVGRVERFVDGLALSLDMPPGWESFGPEFPDYIAKSVRGPQGAEGQIVWAAYPSRGDGPWECSYLQAWQQDTIGESLEGLAAAVASVPGTDLVAGPVEVTVGGVRALHVVFTVRDDVGCDPGFFHIYPNTIGGALWAETQPGDTVRVWIVDTPQRWLFVEAKTKPDASPTLEAEIQAIIDSIAFE